MKALLRYLRRNFLYDLKLKAASILKIPSRQFSQLGEELVIANILGRLSKPCPKSYLDIGAFHSWRLSNTYRLYKEGYRGIVADPNPEKIRSFKFDRPLDVCIQAAIVPDDFQNPKVTLVSPSSNNGRESIEPLYNQNYRSGSIGCSYEADTMSISKLVEIAKLELEGEIGIVNIDIEGFEGPVMLSWPFSVSKPAILCIEHVPTDYNGSGRIEDLISAPLYIHLKTNGYLLASICDASLIFVDEDYYVPPS